MPTTRRQFVSASIAASFVHARPASDRPPNILYIIADDHAGYVMGSHGNKLAHTPNLDRLAAEGVRFANHFCNSPVCTPSRQSILTGQLPHSAGVTTLSTPLDESKPTFSKHLKARGYQTAVYGKMHFNRPGTPGMHGFDVAHTEDIVNRDWLQEVGPPNPPQDIRVKPRWQPFRDPANIWLNAEALPFPRRTEEMKSSWLVRKACQHLEQHKNDPFAMWVSFQEPHSPFDFPLEYRNRFDPKKFPVHPLGAEDEAQIPVIFRSLTNAERQGIAAAYYTSVNFLDYSVGRVLQKLRDLKLDENTIVVYMADHGYSLGQHGRFEKHCMFDPALHVPLIFRAPGRIKPGVVRDLTESVDVAPTILDLVDAEPLAKAHGQSLRPYLEGAKPSQPRTSIFSEYLENEEACIRTNEWKFALGSGRRFRTDGYSNEEQIRWALSRRLYSDLPREDRKKLLTQMTPPSRTIRLFNLKNDPGELQNVASKHPEVVKQLSLSLLERFRNTHPEAQSEPEKADTLEKIEYYLPPRDAA